jgi:hypothetical protein
MDTTILEYLIKAKQQQIFEDFERIHMSQAEDCRENGIFNVFVQGFEEILFAARTGFTKHVMPVFFNPVKTIF